MTTPPALLLVGHGTRDDAEAEAFRSFTDGLATDNPGIPVAGGFTEPVTPALADAVAGLVGQGVRRIAAVPLAPVCAGHAGDGILAALAREERRHPGTSFAIGRPLGPHPDLLEILERRVEEALGTSPRSPRDRADVTVLLVGPGSCDPDANAEVHRAARLLWEGRGLAGVETAFASLAAPDVPAGLDRCRTLGARRIVVLPCILFPGVLPDRIRMQAEGWAAAHPGTQVVPAGVIRPAELAGLVMERYRETPDASSGAPADRGQRTPSQGGDRAHAR
ncbi:CbiX/SirB N-terminal domain-containing protein [Streptomyces sodiiphilus]|uniref:CbiX/SirB N-terminal domain-containing protein n=1 Tax=Streptomyces sodiiphilus TaxID=226217 RepID=A0ABP5ANJ5_9ACTN